MEEKIDLILAAQDVQDNDMKELKKDRKQLNADVGLLPKNQEQMKTVQGNINFKGNININKASILTLNLQHKPNPNANDPSLQDKIEEHVRRINKKKQLIIKGIAENQPTPLDALVGQIIFDTGVKVTAQDIDQVFRVGTKTKFKPRAVLVTFTKQSTMDKIYCARREMTSNPAC